MKLLKALFLVLVAVGICGAVYVALYGGMRLAGMSLAGPQGPAATTQPAPAAQPAVEEDPRDVLARRLGEVGKGVGPVASSAPPPPPTTILPLPYRTWLPPAGGPSAPRPLAGESARPMRAGPALDVPPLADAAAPPAPSPVRPPAVAPPAVASPEPGRMPVTAVASGAAPRVLADPVTERAVRASAQAVTAAAPPLRETPAPFLKLAIPDPSPVAGGPELRNPPADQDPPVTAPGRPARVTLEETKGP